MVQIVFRLIGRLFEIYIKIFVFKEKDHFTIAENNDRPVKRLYNASILFQEKWVTTGSPKSTAKAPSEPIQMPH